MLTWYPTPRLVPALVALGVAFTFTSPAAAQGNKPPRPRPDCQTGCVGVSVSPDGGSVNVQANSTLNSVNFDITNTGTTSGSYTFSCSATGNVTCGTVTPTSKTMAAGMDAIVNVKFNAGAVGTGRITLTASGGGGDTGFINVTVQSTGAPVVALRNYNRDNIDRSLCLTAGAGEAAAWSCGDLVITHSMPVYATTGRDRALTLIHNSGTAYPRPAIAAVVSQPNSAPVTVFAQLVVGGQLRDSASYFGWTGGNGRQIVLDFNGAFYSTGAYPLQLKVQNRYASSMFETVVNDTILIVNRFVDEFGAGFGIAGVERIYPNQPAGSGHILWVGGDGSARLYRKLATGTQWEGSLGAYRDTIALSGGVYTRTLRHGIQVKFSGSGVTLGRHISTVNRAGQQSTFSYNAAGDRLTSIQVPPACGAACTYTLAYDANGNLDYIQDPAGRRLDATFNANDGRLSSLTDPDGNSVVFGWDGDRRIISRRTRRGYTTTYEYSLNRPVGSRITKVTVPVGRVAGDNTAAVTVFDNWNDKGLAVAFANQVTWDTASVFTTIVGPRPGVADDAKFWVDRWGAPTKTLDPLGGTTTLVRGNPSVPALVTRVRFPDGRIDSMAYDGRGNLTALIDSTKHTTFPLPQSVTTYAYASGNTKDSPSSVTEPGNAVTSYVYNTMGLTTQVTSPNGHVTKYAYGSGATVGLVKAVTEVSVPAWDSVLRKESAGTAAADTLHTGFAFNALGNVVADTSPMKRVRRYDRDGLQRVINFYDAAGHRTEYTYDPLNRTTVVEQHVEQAGTPAAQYPGDPAFPTALATFYTYTIDVLTQVRDPRGITRAYQYDFASRKIGETDDYGQTETTWLNHASQVDSVRARSGKVVRNLYDAAGRRSKTAWPQVLDDVGQVATGKDSVLYGYDVMGRMTSAAITWPSAATVTRTYFGTGAVRTEVTNSSAPSMVTTNAYYYDVAGHRLAHRIGVGGDAVHSDSIHYTWNLPKGELQQLKVWWRTIRFGAVPQDSVRFKWDAMGRRDSVAYSNGLKIGFAYDKDGMQRLICTATRVTAPATNDVSQFRILHDWVDQDGMIRKTNMVVPVGSTPPANPAGCVQVNSLFALNGGNTYDNRHQLKTKAENGHNWSYLYDASGNMTQTISDTERFDDVMDPGHNRLLRRFQAASNSYWIYQHDADGGRFDENPCPTANPCPKDWGYRRYLYDGMGRAVGFNQAGCIQFPGGSSCGIQYQSSGFYDPLGRLLTPYENGAPNLGYDGDNVVRTGPDVEPGAGGYAWTFIHGPGTDDPLIGHYPGTSNLFAFYVTDGNGRQYRVVDRVGQDVEPSLEYTQKGGKYAGGTTNSMGFGAERKSSMQVPGISFFRNRIYDQTTGRWTQEDPIGVAGGLNLYQFNGNNPASYTDPFGLCPKGNTICPLVEFTTTVLGGLGGFIAGGGGGTLLALATGGAALPAAPALAYQGALGGAAGGLALGKAITQHMFSEDDAAGKSSGGAEPSRDETGNFDYAVKKLGLDRNEASETLHKLKKDAGLKGSDNVIFDTKTGNVLDNSREVIGNLFDGP